MLPKTNVDEMLNKLKFPYSLMNASPLHEGEKFCRVSAFCIKTFDIIIIQTKR